MIHPVLDVHDLQVSIGGSQILRGVTLSIPQNSVFCLMGRNGVGKTSTLKALTGLLPITSGRLSFLEQDLSKMPSENRARLGIGYVPQGREIFPQMTVEENLLIGAVAQGIKPASIAKQLDRIYTLFPILKEFLPRKGGMLSGGQQQQLAIGRALLTEPKLLILDEPTEGIQPNIIDQIGTAIRLLREEDGMSILLVEQYLDFCKEFGDSFCILERGRVAAAGPMPNLTESIIKEYLTV
jgi:urea transport system ATP-binding protein